MNDLESRLQSAAALLPDAPEVPEAAFHAVHRAIAASSEASRGTSISWARRRRGRGGFVAALAGVLAVVGIASAGVLSFGLPGSADDRVDSGQAVAVRMVKNGSQSVVLAPGSGIFAGEICMSLANAQGPTDVSPLICRPPSRADAPGFEYSERRPGDDSWAVHVRLPDVGDFHSAIVTEFEIPARGGRVSFLSGDRLVVRTYEDLGALDARADRDLRAHIRAGLVLIRRELAAPAAQQKFARLPVDQQEALRLRVVDELDYPAIADRTGATLAVTRNRVSSALAALGIEMNGMLP